MFVVFVVANLLVLIYDPFELSKKDVGTSTREVIENSSQEIKVKVPNEKVNESTSVVEEPDEVPIIFEEELSDASFNGCLELIPGHNIQEANRANIIIIGMGIEKLGGIPPLEILKSISEHIIDFDGDNYGLFNVTPFKENKDKFNLWYVSEIPPLENCGGPHSYGCSSPPLNVRLECELPNQYLIFVQNSVFTANGVHSQPSGLDIPIEPSEVTLPVPIQLSEEGLQEVEGNKLLFFEHIIEGSKISVSEHPSKVFVHEFGHAFGDLADERPLVRTNSGSEPEQLNCWGKDISEETCMEDSPWSHLIGNGCGENGVIDCTYSDPNYNVEIGCFEGCAKWATGTFNPTRRSIMFGSSYEPYKFGLWNEELLSIEIEKFSGV